MAGTDLALLLFKHTATVVLVLLALRLLRSSSAARRVFAARCGMAALLLMPLLWIIIPPLPMDVNAPMAISALLDPPLAIPDMAWLAALPSTEEAFAAPVRATDWGRLLLIAYAIGVLLHLLRLARNLRRLRRVADAARSLDTLPNAHAWTRALEQGRQAFDIRRPVRLLVSNEAASPYSWGLRHPVIVLDPHSLAHAAPAPIITHELAHIAAHDWPALLLARCLLAFYWWHPLMYPLVRALEHDTECSADDAVLAGGIAPSHYAHTLVSVSRNAFSPKPSATLANRIAGRGAQLLARVAFLLEAHRPRGRVTPSQWLTGAVATAVLVSAMASLKLRGEDVIWPDRLLAADAMDTRQTAIQLLEALGNPNFTQLAAAMRSGRFEQRHAVAVASFRQRAAIPPLLLAMRDHNPAVRRLAVWGLSEMRFAETAPAVAALLADPDAAVRAEAVGALGDMGETRWLKPMMAMLRDRDGRVRARVAHALGDLGAKAGVPMLAAMLNDPDPQVAEQVQWALQELK
jgi:beta-lactamase regulating signal transducer with metallopeptidase domain